MIAWVPARPERALLCALPPSLELRTIPDDPAVAPERARVAAVVPPTGDGARARAVIAALPGLRLVQSLSAGVDPLLPAVPPTATVCSARGARDGAVAEWVIAALLADAKRLPAAGERQRERRWAPYQAGDVAGARVVILGHGAIGAAVAGLLVALGAEPLPVARRARAGVAPLDQLPQLLAGADVLVNLLPATAETGRLVDGPLLRRLPDGALYVSAGRGATTDTDALLAELRAGRIRAVLDVVDPEPLPPDHPLWDAPGLTITPHVAGGTPAATRAAWRLAGRQLARFARGEPLENVVRPPAAAAP